MIGRDLELGEGLSVRCHLSKKEMWKEEVLAHGHLRPIHQEDRRLLRNAGRELLHETILLTEAIVLRVISLLPLQRATVAGLLQTLSTVNLFTQKTVSVNSMTS